jgi:hypothetical protein
MANPSGKGGWAKGQSGNPSGLKGRHISDLSRESRRYAHLALTTLVRICRKGEERNRLSAARELLDRGYGRPLQMIDASLLQRKLSELSPDELAALEARLVTAQAEPQQLELLPAAGRTIN